MKLLSDKQRYTILGRGNKLCESRHNMPPPLSSVGAEAPPATEPTAPADDNVAVGSHGQYVPTVTAAAAAASKAAW